MNTQYVSESNEYQNIVLKWAAIDQRMTEIVFFSRKPIGFIAEASLLSKAMTSKIRLNCATSKSILYRYDTNRRF